MMKQRTFFDDEHKRDLEIKAMFVPGSDTSETAAEQIESVAGKMRRLVYDHIKSQDEGATCDECEVSLDLKHQTCSARITELKRLGSIVDTGRRRKTRSGRGAAVYVAKEQ